MKQIVVISGKGGTGKTVLTASFASLAKNKVIVDCDVDAADLHLLLHPEIRERHEFRSGLTAQINSDLCEQCGECISVCRFNAISDNFIIDQITCEGCSICSYICPKSAIVIKENIAGEWYISDTKYGPFVHAKLGIAEGNSGKLVSLIKRSAIEIAERKNMDYIIIDGSPGIGCPVFASIANVDLALIVTEPTLSGIHDMIRVAQVTKHFKVSTKVVINKFDINNENTEEIKKICHEEDLEVVAQLPFSEKVNESIVQGSPIVEFCKNGIVKEIYSLWEKIK